MPSNALDLDAVEAIHARYVEGFTLDMQGYAWEVAQVLPQLVARVRELEADAKWLERMFADSRTCVFSLMFNHPKYGTGCTVVVGDRDATVANQPDAITAIVAAYDAAIAGEEG